jgi:TonB family protein
VSAVAEAIASELAPNDFQSAASAAGPTSTGPYKIGGGVSAPSLLHKVEPEYTEEARLARLVGKVVLFIVVGSDGKAHEMKVTRSLGLGLDEKAIAAVSEWRFRPGSKEGEPVDVQASIEVNFRLLDRDPKSVTHLTRVEFRTPPGASRPYLGKHVFPPVRESENATLTVGFDVDERGNPVNIHVDKASDTDWANEVSAALRRWKFLPGLKDGVAISIPCTMDFVRGPTS